MSVRCIESTWQDAVLIMTPACRRVTFHKAACFRFLSSIAETSSSLCCCRVCDCLDRKYSVLSMTECPMCAQRMHAITEQVSHHIVIAMFGCFWQKSPFPAADFRRREEPARVGLSSSDGADAVRSNRSCLGLCAHLVSP